MDDLSTKFSSKGKKYHEYRPYYPHKIFSFIFEQLGISGKITDKVAADIATGTGFLTMQLAGSTKVIAIEPGDTMREVAKENLQSLKNSVYPFNNGKSSDENLLCISNINNSIVSEGKSNNTTLPDKSVDFIISGTAAHWFMPPEETVKEWNRILKDDGKVALVFNMMDKNHEHIEELINLYEKKFVISENVTWSNLGLFQTKTIADRFISKTDMNTATEHFNFMVNKEQFLEWLGTMSGPSRADFSKEQEKCLSDYFDKHSIDFKYSVPEEKIIEIPYKTTAFVGALLGRGARTDKHAEIAR